MSLPIRSLVRLNSPASLRRNKRIAARGGGGKVWHRGRDGALVSLRQRVDQAAVGLLFNYSRASMKLDLKGYWQARGPQANKAAAALQVNGRRAERSDALEFDGD